MIEDRNFDRLSVVPWTLDLALRAARVDIALPRPDQEAQIQSRIDSGLLAPEPISLLRRAGYAVRASS